ISLRSHFFPLPPSRCSQSYGGLSQTNEKDLLATLQSSIEECSTQSNFSDAALNRPLSGSIPYRTAVDPDVKRSRANPSPQQGSRTASFVSLGMVILARIFSTIRSGLG